MNGRTIGRVLVWSLPLWIALVGYGWAGPKNNPRDGWSLAKVWLGVVGPSPSGDWAYHTGGGPFLEFDLRAVGYGADEHLWVIVRRTRTGLLVPWLETTDLWAISASDSFRDLRTDTTNPAWHGVLDITRPFFAEGGTDWHRTILAGIDAERAGKLPRHKVLFGMLAREALVLVAHAMLLAGLGFMLGRAGRARMTKSRRTKGLCPDCGYDRAGAGAVCPECGNSGPEPYHSA